MSANPAAAQPIEIEEITAAASEDSLAQARELLLDYGRFIIAQPGAARFCFGALESEASRLPFSYLEQNGGCLMARVHGKPAGFVAWRSLPVAIAPDAWELKRLWVPPAARGLGLGRILTRTVLERAVQAARKAVFLDTAPASMVAAHRIYLELGFTPCARYNENPVEGVVFLVKYL